jgi:hypothetical protein
METKTIIVGAVALIAILLGAFILLSPPPVTPPVQNDYPNPLGGQTATMGEFADALMSSQTVYLVEDIRGLEKYPISRNNIMQCGVDFAGSQGLAGKEVNIYILEGNECSASEAGGNLTIKALSECHAAVASAFGKAGNSVIWIEKGYSPSVYPSGLVVRINETYTQGMCNIRFVVPAPVEVPLPAWMNETDAGNTTTPAQPAENGTSAETEEASPGESATPDESSAEETVPPEPAEPIPPYAD